MTFKEKIDKILETNKLGINSVSAFEDEIKAGRGAVNDFYKEDRDPGRITLKKIKTFPGLNPVWWDTGKGDIYLSNNTHEPKPDHYKQNGHDSRETFYADLIENNEQYTLIPRAVLSDYKIVPDKMLDTILGEMKAAMNMAKESLTEKYELIIKVKENRIKELEQKLRSKFPGKD